VTSSVAVFQVAKRVKYDKIVIETRKKEKMWKSKKLLSKYLSKM